MGVIDYRQCFTLLLALDISELSLYLLLIDCMLIIIQLSRAMVNEVFSLVTMPSHSAKELDELSSMHGTHLDVEQQCLKLILGSEVSASGNSSFTDDGPY